MFRKQYKLEDILVDDKVYQVKSYRVLWKEYLEWKRNLQRNEISAFRRYRFGKKLSQNINADLRKNKANLDAEIIKAALKKRKAPFDFIVYRNLAKDEAEIISQREMGDIIHYADFKGCHVRKNIVEFMGNLYSAKAYAIYLIPKDMEVAYINYWALQHCSEKELLINCGTDWMIYQKKTIFKNKKCYVLKMQMNLK